MSPLSEELICLLILFDNLNIPACLSPSHMLLTLCLYDRYPDGTYPSVDAANNWWGGDVESFVAGRIWERKDDDNLIEVNYNPYYKTNASVLHGQ